jgi:hypothetical protein
MLDAWGAPCLTRSVMQLSDYLQLKSKTRFRLRLELTTAVFGFLASQALLLKVPTLVELLVTLLLVLYMSVVGKELKTRREPFTRKQKHILFGLGASFYGMASAALFIAAFVKQTPVLWIAFALTAVLSFVILFHEYDQLYKDGDAA